MKDIFCQDGNSEGIVEIINQRHKVPFKTLILFFFLIFSRECIQTYECGQDSSVVGSISLSRVSQDIVSEEVKTVLSRTTLHL